MAGHGLGLDELRRALTELRRRHIPAARARLQQMDSGDFADAERPALAALFDRATSSPQALELHAALPRPARESSGRCCVCRTARPTSTSSPPLGHRQPAARRSPSRSASTAPPRMR